MPLFVIYIVLCIGLGVLGMNRKFGFWGYLFGSLLLSPLIGLILVLASDVRKPEKNKQQAEITPAP